MKSGYTTQGAIEKWGVVALYLLLCGLYFSPIAAPYKMVYPLLLLTLCSLRHKCPLLTLALACSALGDLFGTLGNLLPQIGAFALAHICYFLVLRRLVSKTSLRAVALAAALPAVLCLVAYLAILPAIEGTIIQLCIVGYTLLIGAMTTAALLTGSRKVGLGATLFALSDLLLAYLIFLSPNHSLLCLSLLLYFAGQLLLWLGLTERVES